MSCGRGNATRLGIGNLFIATSIKCGAFKDRPSPAHWSSARTMEQAPLRWLPSGIPSPRQRLPITKCLADTTNGINVMGV
jgi:hypothetical protein